jgi:hypothetical protein
MGAAASVIDAVSLGGARPAPEVTAYLRPTLYTCRIA